MITFTCSEVHCFSVKIREDANLSMYAGIPDLVLTFAGANRLGFTIKIREDVRRSIYERVPEVGITCSMLMHFPNDTHT